MPTPVPEMDLSSVVTAIGALGTASFALVDTTKWGYKGGISHSGFRFIEEAVGPFAGKKRDKPYARMIGTLHGNWINGTALADQKAIAKSLIKLRLSGETAAMFAEATGVNPRLLSSVAAKIASGTRLEQPETDAFGRFDLALTATLDEGYNRADQKYRNSAKVLATLFAVVLAALGGWAVAKDLPLSQYLGSRDFALSVLCGLLATPLAPLAKDLASALQAGVKVAQAVKK